MKKIILAVILLFVTTVVSAEEENSVENIKKAFQSVAYIEFKKIDFPSVVEFPIDFKNGALRQVLVIEKESGEIQPAIVIEKSKKISYTVRDSLDGADSQLLADGDMETFKEYFSDNGVDQKRVDIFITSEKNIDTDSLTLYLDKFVALPEAVEISAMVGGQEKIILGKSKPVSSALNFPRTKASEFKISLYYVQPLRIREIYFTDHSAGGVAETRDSVRFLAQPGKTYETFFELDRYVRIETGEMPNLTQDEEIVSGSIMYLRKNTLYEKADSDGDGVVDEMDNCVSVKNSDQADLNHNGRGDACDDFDRDGVINSADNCSDMPNRNQADEDADGVGDICDQNDDRVLQDQKWFPLAVIFLVFAVVGLIFIKTFRSERH
ncbi:MAG: thrombospondin type 3 repeat-containing protein [Candidatus Moraniibacteriota bacterium]